MTRDAGGPTGEVREMWGLMAEFGGPDELVSAAETVRRQGYTRIDAFTPYPIEELSETVEPRRSKVPLITFLGGLVGALTGFFLQYWTQVIVYPMNIGGRPHNSWPAFIVVTFELTILFASVSAVVGMILVNGLPRPYHPVFNVPGFERASRDGFFLTVEATDPRFERAGTAEVLRSLGAREVNEVES
jgi:hypothetical protein